MNYDEFKVMDKINAFEVNGEIIAASRCIDRLHLFPFNNTKQIKMNNQISLS